MNKPLSFENLLDISGLPEKLVFLYRKKEENAIQEIIAFLQKVYKQNYNETLINVSLQKQNMMSDVLGSKSCLFEKITTHSWEKNFLENFSQDENRKKSKNVFLWGHIFIQSDWELGGKISQEGGGIEFIFDNFGSNLVEINHEQYYFGERLIIAHNTEVVDEDYSLTIHIPTIVIDSRMSEKILKSIQNRKVLGNIYTLYALSSEQAMIRNFFQEEEIIARGNRTETLEDILRNIPCFNFNQYGVNFKRLQKKIFELARETNPSLLSGVISLYEQIESITREWEEDVREYVMFIALERLCLIYNSKLHSQKMREYPQFLELERDEDFEIHTILSTSLVQDVIHDINGGHEGIIYRVKDSEIQSSFSFAEMASITAKKILKPQSQEVYAQIEE